MKAFKRFRQRIIGNWDTSVFDALLIVLAFPLVAMIVLSFAS